MSTWFQRRATLVSAWLVIALLAVAAAAAPQEPDNRNAAKLFARIDQMLVDVEKILGLEAKQPIPRDLIDRGEINSLVERRLAEETTPEELRAEELFMRLFGFVSGDFDLAEQVVDVLTEQAAALYDYRTKTLYLATWTPEDMQEFALVHELAHAVADQYFDLEKFIDEGGNSDGDMARAAVVEGQASWVMTEYVFRALGRSLADNPLLAASAAGASRFEVQNYPVFSAAPPYIQETLLFPYTDGLLFQQAIVEKLGKKAFRRVFEQPPQTTQQVLDPKTYFENQGPLEPELPPLDVAGFERTSEGRVGQLDHAVLIKQYFDQETVDELASRWRGGRFEIWENPARTQAVLRYSAAWADDSAAEGYFELYRQLIERKATSFETTVEKLDFVGGRTERGRFEAGRRGSTVWSLEGLPDTGEEPVETRIAAAGE